MTLLQQTDSRFSPSHDGVAHWQAAVQSWLSDDRCAIYLAETGGEVIGYIVGWIQTGPPGLAPECYGLVSELTLNTHTYHGGLGRTLVATLRDWFTTQEVTHLVARVPTRQAVEQAFWRSLGATEYIDFMWIDL